MNPTNRCTKEDVEEWLKPTLRKEGLKDYTINISGSSAKGDGYLGDITFVEVSGKSATNEEKVYSFVIKSGKKSTELRDIMPIKSAFENEMLFYNKILPVFIDFQKEKGVKEPFNNAPKCYDTIILEDMEVLILENLKQRDFILHDRKFPMNRAHVEKVVKTYGKLHAISFALRDQKPDLFKQLSRELVDILKLIKKTMKPPPKTYNLYGTIIKYAEEDNEHEVVAKAYSLHEKVENAHEITNPNDPYAVILHGDCWNNNFMFKYADNKSSLLDVCLLDFQLSRLASPVYDLSYFLFTSISEVDIKDFDEIVELYYRSLSDSLREMGSDPNQMFPYEELLKQWKTYSLFGLMMMPNIINICLSEQDEVPDLVEAAESDGDFGKMFIRSVKSKEQYRRRTIPIIKLAIEKGFAQ
ncbi:hypothetical protein Zmor_021679 [Zophobas morio]|uniref:CHK kinase-like domain-containing protein n=1 Tax=Zophobas morio TaxID=2755281 RepID=A0AA38I6J4_9CUCU|nr:hypothetical protein Zmor_021679 [Zophobas morio]